jgi:ABC-type cobalamin/Fe3+-siderophores transport system ATPase subunit
MGICFNNLSIGVEKESKFYVDDLCVNGKIVAITGASAAGKSTCLKIIKKIRIRTMKF